LEFDTLAPCFQRFCCNRTFRNCLCCSWNPMQWSVCLPCSL